MTVRDGVRLPGTMPSPPLSPPPRTPLNIDFQCDQCGKHYAAGDNLAGKKLKCKNCGKVLRIPGTPPPKAESPTAPATASSTKPPRSAESAAKSSSAPKSSTSSPSKPPPLPP